MHLNGIPKLYLGSGNCPILLAEATYIIASLKSNLLNKPTSQVVAPAPCEICPRLIWVQGLLMGPSLKEI